MDEKRVTEVNRSRGARRQDFLAEVRSAVIQLAGTQPRFAGFGQDPGDLQM